MLKEITAMKFPFLFDSYNSLLRAQFYGS